MRTNEASFEEAIKDALVDNGGYRFAASNEYDPAWCLLPADAIDFVRATQPEEWEKLRAQYGDEGVYEAFLTRLSKEIANRGALDVLRKGIKDRGSGFKLVYFRPASRLNPEHQELYRANRFSVMRQVFYKVNHKLALDVGIFINGIPIFTAELKNHFTGQRIEDAIKQYRLDRDPREPLFAFKRCLAHFAVDNDVVFVTTQLEGESTRFLPFNKGKYGGAGNPPNADGFAVAYLWEDLWAKDSLLDLLQNFIHEIELEDDEGKPLGTYRMVFPRYHQLDAVRRLIDHARKFGTDQRYLIQHSAGSGKSNTIAWLAHRLATLHDEQDERVFDSIIIVSDRRVLDRQLQRTVRLFEQVKGTVENIDKTSRDLKKALEDGKQIIVTTLQKFPVIANQMGELKGTRFALIIDEAHSSQSGESVQKVNQTLEVASLEAAAQADRAGEAEDMIETISRSMELRRHLPNVSAFAFTATPKAKTLELFGTPDERGRLHPFSLYTMCQAIDEGFIMDVLQNYTTYKAYWRLFKTIEDDPKYDKSKASRLLKNYVELHDHAIHEKVAIMAEHFHEKVARRIKGKAKAMIVTRSRLHAVRYFFALKKYLHEQGYPYEALVAFSGTVKDAGLGYTEAGMNGFSESKTAKAFEQDRYRFLVVANKFQTGFDQALLHTMYVDKVLGGVNAVQTLSRLNRVHPDKEETMVLDFANDADAIKDGFAPYYEKTLLGEQTDPNLLYDFQTQLLGFDIFLEDDVDRFAAVYWKKGATQDQLHAVLSPVVDVYQEADETAQVDFRGKLRDYIRVYAFLSQILTFTDADLEKLYAFARFLLRKLPLTLEQLPIEIQQNIDLDSYRIRETYTGDIQLERQPGELTPQSNLGSYGKSAEEIEALSAIIQQLNDRFGLDLGQHDLVALQQVQEQLVQDDGLRKSMEVNTPASARLTFDTVFKDILYGLFKSNFDFFRLLNDDQDVRQQVSDWLFEWYQRHSAA